MANDRHAWRFDPNIQPERRPGNALEYIAYYLDRIDQHLEVIANSVKEGGVNEQLRLQLMNVEKAILKTAGD